MLRQSPSLRDCKTPRFSFTPEGKRKEERTKVNTNQPNHRLKTNPLHVRPRPPNRQRPEPPNPRSPRQHCSQSHRPRRRANPPQPTPHNLPDNGLPLAGRASHFATTQHCAPATQAAAQAQAADEVGAVRAQKGYREVQREARRGAGGEGAAQEGGV